MLVHDTDQTTETPPHPDPVANPIPDIPQRVIISQTPRQLSSSQKGWFFTYGVAFSAVILMVGLLAYGMGASMLSNSRNSTSSSSSSSTSMNMGQTSTSADVPNATQEHGGQLATYTVDSDGAKHFTFTAQQVMWDVVGGQRVLAWTINGTIPGPTIRVTAGDHIRVTFVNHFPKATAVHWHGLQVPSSQDGVPGVGQDPIQPGQKYLYDFTVGNQDIGTHWYHSHYDDMEQVGNGFYGAFVVDAKAGTPEAAQAIHADVEYTEFIGMTGSYYTINGKSFPDTQPILVKHGQTVHLRLIGSDTQQIHPMHLHGHTFSVVAEGGRLLDKPIQKDTLEVAPGDTYDIVFQAWAAPGSVYPFHCHILSHLMNPGQSGDEMGGLIALVEYAK
jgi:FtsP/CotA-like multicopper oxidase with cupredoxin domain